MSDDAEHSDATESGDAQTDAALADDAVHSDDTEQSEQSDDAQTDAPTTKTKKPASRRSAALRPRATKPRTKKPRKPRAQKPPEQRMSAKVRLWLSRNRKKAAVAAASAFVVAGAFAGAALQPYLMDRATVATKLRIAQTAANAINTLWSYTPEDMDKLSDRSAKFLGGDFEEQYRKYIDAIAATNKQAKVTSTTKVVGAAVESLRGGPEATEATAIVYTNTTSSTPQSNNIPSMKYLSYRLELHRYGRDWRVTKMTTVTSLDLTPKLGL